MFWRAWFRSYLLVLIAILVMFLVVFLAKDESLGGVSIEPRLWQHLSQVLPMAIFVAVFWSTAHTLSVWTMDGRWKNTQLLGIPSYVVLRGWEYGLILSSGALFIYFWALPAPIQPSWSTDHLLEERQVSYAGVDFIIKSTPA